MGNPHRRNLVPVAPEVVLRARAIANELGRDRASKALRVSVTTLEMAINADPMMPKTLERISEALAARER